MFRIVTGTWNVQLEDGMHSVAAELKWGFWTHKLKITWDGNTIVVSSIVWSRGVIRRFEWSRHKFVLTVIGRAFLGGHLALSMDAVEVSTGGVVTEQHKAPLPSLQFVQEQNVVESEEVVSVIEHPFDNIDGNHDYDADLELSNESTNEVTLETTNQLSGKLGLDLFSVLHAEVAAQLAKKTGATAGQKVTRAQKVHVKVGANKSVVYQVIWKQKVRTGEHVYVTDRGRLTVPYRMIYGLSYGLRTIDRTPDAR